MLSSLLILQTFQPIIEPATERAVSLRARATLASLRLATQCDRVLKMIIQSN